MNCCRRSARTASPSQRAGGSYSVALGSQPDGDVVVTLSISPSGRLTADAEELTFTAENWDSPQTVTLTAGTDDDALNFWQEILHAADVEGFVVGRHNEALADCTTAIELDPDDAGRWRRRTGNRRWPA